MQSLTRSLLRHEFKLTLALLAAALLAFGVALTGAARPSLSSAWPAAAAVVVFLLLKTWCRWQRERLLRELPLPQFLKRKLRETYPHLSGKDCDLVERGLRQFFIACLRSRKQFVAMPSRVVDSMWHEFILHTQAYQQWCELTLGWFLHHTPAEVLGARATNNDGLRRAWYWACRDEAIQPKSPSRLPLLFALDAKLQIENGYHYQADCRDIQRKSEAGGDGAGVYCGSSFSDGSFSGDADGFGGADSADASAGDSDSGSSDGGGCGGGGD
jgi:hypothetical protein